MRACAGFGLACLSLSRISPPLGQRGRSTAGLGKPPVCGLPHFRAHGLAAYLSDEVQPSIDGLVEAGYPPPAAYAYPFGEATDELNAALLAIVPRVRVSPGSCPY